MDKLLEWLINQGPFAVLAAYTILSQRQRDQLHAEHKADLKAATEAALKLADKVHATVERLTDLEERRGHRGGE